MKYSEMPTIFQEQMQTLLAVYDREGVDPVITNMLRDAVARDDDFFYGVFHVALNRGASRTLSKTLVDYTLAMREWARQLEDVSAETSPPAKSA